MSMLFILILLLLASGLYLIKYVKGSILVLILALGGYATVGCGSLPAILLENLQDQFTQLTHTEWKNNNAIIILGAGTVKLPGTGRVKPAPNAYSRIYIGADNYFVCKKAAMHCTIILSGGDAAKTGKSEAEVYKTALMDVGVHENDILIEPHSMNTFENAKYTSELLKAKKFDQIILVTSGFHLSRSLLYFSHFEINAIPIAADYFAAKFSVLPLDYNFILNDFAIHEYMGIVRYHLYQYMGWN